jgi:hypothetical protein
LGWCWRIEASNTNGSGGGGGGGGGIIVMFEGKQSMGIQCYMYFNF